MGEKTVISLNLDKDLVDKLKKSGNASKLASEILERAIFEEERAEKDREEAIRKRVEAIGVRTDFRVPVGDVICYPISPQTQLWWCPEEKLSHVAALCAEWELNGFKLFVGKKGGGTWYSPEVIEELAQERKKNGRFSVSCKMVGAYVGDRLVWLEITDARKALAYMREHTNIPVAVRADGHKYGVDKQYTAAFDLANSLFIHYWANGRPKTAESDSATESDFITMYDL